MKHLIIRCYGGIRTVGVTIETARMYYVNYGKDRFDRNDPDVIAVCENADEAKVMRTKIEPIERAFRDAQRIAGEECSRRCLEARAVRDAALREIINAEP